MESDEHIPLPGEPDPEEESPFRRRSKAVEVRRGRFPRRAGRWLRGMLVGVLAFAAVGYGGYELASYALTAPRFELSSGEDVQIAGNRYASREEVLNALGLAASGRSDYGINIFRLSLDDERKQVESLPWVQSATIARAYPRRLSIHIVERIPVAFINVGGRLKLVDGDGVVLDKPDKAIFAFPVLEGLEAEGNAGDRRTRLELFQKFMRELGDDVSSAGWLISEVDLSDAVDLKAVLVQSLETIPVHFGNDNFSERFHDFLTILPELRKSHAKIDSIDLRYHDQIVVNPERAGKSEK